ncbi:MAG: Chlorophyll A-B binding protein [Phormidesmis priestleyi Ana]|uniref:Chlorophyll A-B binding protein n=1 Tax=Phormidesmis priestleyi Ana TaxID=1666911 RepID=A0A0P7YVJ1_9CYAN|nr:MAG: Chlorophyll A-B binding protein [Phormidesmis priestleyi Ana]
MPAKISSDPSINPQAIDPQKNDPQKNADPTVPSFGWTQYAEKINGRFAMIGFIALLLTEFFAKQDFLTWIGLR